MFSSIRLYPNPATNIIYVEGVPKGSMLTIYNEKGNALKQSNSDNGIYSFHIQQLPVGTYYIQSTYQGKLIAQLKFIKQPN